MTQLSLFGQKLEAALAPHVTISIDGGCSPNPGRGAWAAILRSRDTEKILSGGPIPDTTNNRMEMMAAAVGMERLTRPCRVTLRTDSMVVVWCIEAGMLSPEAKKRRRWQNRAKNPDLVLRIWAQLARHQVTPTYVKGHFGDPDNERCDRICNQIIHGAQSPAATSLVA